MAYNYMVSAQKPTAVSCSAAGHFTSATDLNLMVAKMHHFELFTVTSDGLKPIKEIPVFGRIIAMKFFRPSGESKDLLFFVTAKYDSAIVEFVDSGEIITRAHGSVADRYGRPALTGVLLTIDEKHNIIGLRIYDALFKIIEWQPNSREMKAINLHFDDYNIIDLQFLQGGDRPTLAYIYEESEVRHLKTVKLNLDEREFSGGDGTWSTAKSIEDGAAMVVAVPQPLGGCLVLAQNSISYFSPCGAQVSAAPAALCRATITSYGQIDADGRRYIVGDLSGRAYLLALQVGVGRPARDQNLLTAGGQPTQEPVDDAAEARLAVHAINLEYIGCTSIAETLTYLDNGVLFVGSRLGDSQLVRLLDTPVNDPECPGAKTFIQVLDTYANLAPIVDMCLVECESQSQLITCSGAYKDGSLRIIRNGIGIQELANMDLPGVKGVWAVRCRPEAAHSVTPGNSPPLHDSLVVAVAGKTMLLQFDDEDVEETQLEGLHGDAQCMFAANVTLADGKVALLVVSSLDVRLLDVTGGGGVMYEWLPPNDISTSDASRISVAAANELTGQLAVGVGRSLYYLRLGDAASAAQLMQVAEVTFDNDIACVDISSLDGAESRLCAVALWTDISVRLLSLPQLTPVHTEQLGGDVLPRSIMMVNFEDNLYTLVALGDGTMLYFQMDRSTGALADRKKITLGTQQVILRKFTSGGGCNVFACSDRPAVIYSSNRKLIFANVNLKSVWCMCALDTQAYRRCLALADGSALLIGSVDEIQKLHMRTVKLGETPRRIAHQPTSRSFALLTYRSAEPVQCRSVSTRLGRASAEQTADVDGQQQMDVDSSSEGPNNPSQQPTAWCASLTAQNTSASGRQKQLGQAQQTIVSPAVTAAPAPAGPSKAAGGASGGGAGPSTGASSSAAAAAGPSSSSARQPVDVLLEPSADEDSEEEIQSFLVLDDNTFEVQHAHTLGTDEIALSLISSCLGDDKAVYYIVGCAVIQPNEPESREGRLIVFLYQGDGKLQLVHETQIKGAPYSLAVLDGKLCVAINSSVRVYEWTAEKELRLECSYFNFMTALYVKTRGDFILCGDLQRSMVLLTYKPVETTLDEIARDYTPNWMTGVEMIDDDSYVGSEYAFNLFTCSRDAAAASEEDRARLTTIGCVHLGQMVNVFRHGTLVMQQQVMADEQQVPMHTPILFGTVEGGIGLITQTTEQHFNFLSELEQRVAAWGRGGCGRIDHAAWRRFETEQHRRPAQRFVDGDLIETLLDMRREQVSEAVEGLKMPPTAAAGGEDSAVRDADATVDAIVKLVEDLSRIH